MNSSDEKPQIYDPRPRSEIMSSDNYEVPQIVKPAVAVSPLRNPLMWQRDATRFPIELSEAADRNLLDSVSIIATDGFISASRGNLIISKILKVGPAKDTTSETEDARRIPIDSKGFDATIDRPAAASTLHPLPNQPISWHKGKILAENQTKETKIRFSRNEPKPYEQSTTGHCELMDKLMAPEAKTSQVPTPVTHDPRLHSASKHPVQLRHYVEHTSHEVTPIRG
ncbi:hypothetical protein CRE_12242 [Caenorhabditis remanei]|uniref:Uncharacterized protein n=1 Tax=Caenorhabditis remanei TaxID=31234 RepID=E3N720_CAERE|nr:hypothetical protein CRE_12242 [Caenorhabditis remanei]